MGGAVSAPADLVCTTLLIVASMANGWMVGAAAERRRLRVSQKAHTEACLDLAGMAREALSEVAKERELLAKLRGVDVPTPSTRGTL